MSGSFLPSLWSSNSHSLLGSRSRHCYAIKLIWPRGTLPISRLRSQPELVIKPHWQDRLGAPARQRGQGTTTASEAARMTKKILWVVPLVVMLLGSTLYAQDIVGQWQGTLAVGKGFRIVLQIAKSDSGDWSGKLYSIDYGLTPVSSLVLQGSKLTFAVEGVGGTYEGTVSADRMSIQGTWTQGESVPLNFQRATKETAWRIDSSPHSVQFVAVDDNVKLEVLDWGGSGRPLVLLAGLGNTAHIFDRFALKLTST